MGDIVQDIIEDSVGCKLTLAQEIVQDIVEESTSCGNHSVSKKDEPFPTKMIDKILTNVMDDSMLNSYEDVPTELGDNQTIAVVNVLEEIVQQVIQSTQESGTWTMNRFVSKIVMDIIDKI